MTEADPIVVEDEPSPTARGNVFVVDSFSDEEMEDLSLSFENLLQSSFMRESDLSEGDTRVDFESETSEDNTEIHLTETEPVFENPSVFTHTGTEAQSPSACC